MGWHWTSFIVGVITSYVVSFLIMIVRWHLAQRRRGINSPLGKHDP